MLAASETRVTGEPASRAMAVLRAGGAVVVRPESDLLPRFVVTAADSIDAGIVTRLSQVGQGQLYLALTDAQCERLGLESIAQAVPGGYNQVDAIDARVGIATGLSAADRAHTIKLAGSPAASPSDIVRPGHVQPLRAAAAGVLERCGPTEAATDLVTRAGVGEGAVIAPLLAAEGTWAADLSEVQVAEVVAHRWENERLLEVDAAAEIPTPAGDFRVVGFREQVSGGVHLAFLKGDPAQRRDLLLSVHRECVLGTHLRGRLCSCAEGLTEAVVRIQESGGVLVYSQIAPDERGANPFASCPEARRRAGEGGGAEDDEPTERYVVAQILRELKIESVRTLDG